MLRSRWVLLYIGVIKYSTMNYKEIRRLANEKRKEIFDLYTSALIDYVEKNGVQKNRFVDRFVVDVTGFDIEYGQSGRYTSYLDEIYVDKNGHLCFTIYEEDLCKVHLDREFKIRDFNIVSTLFSNLCE